ncbi:predicted protein [Chaetoceros tenuissimus]|uniref:Uncharacterized protein n=1 Tax=Chaetoceros tenuissimus TaxID=426638 RepID=A0AAD3DC60_9STRA|nr:predicted protein [Chaetoceros tenuissimus]
MVISSIAGNSVEEENAQASSPLFDSEGNGDKDRSDEIEELEVDVNLHMLATHSIIFDPCHRRSHLRLGISLFVLLVQIFAAMQLTLDLFHPKCSVHDDCPIGTYCGYRKQRFNSIVSIVAMDCKMG